ncbi:hypothetical protein [Algibacter sp. R77976]|uniref:hypothetical protein n=1 Tax=Algibacter sp. R77976 TaxID=3093873 RepID=UPI0037CA8139
MKKIVSLFFLFFCLKLVAQVGIATAYPITAQDAKDSLSLNVTTTVENLTLDETHYTIVISGNHNITLPKASSCIGRVYIIKNPTNIIQTISSYNNLSDEASESINGETSIKLRSDGTYWRQIDSNKIIYEK